MPNPDNTPQASNRPTFEAWISEGRKIAGMADELAEILRADGDPIRRSRAVLALGYIGSSASVQPLIDALGDQPLVATEAAASLGRLAPSEAIGPLVDAMTHGDSNVRANAVLAGFLHG